MANNPYQQNMQEKRLKHQLHVQSHQIEQVFNHYHVPANVNGGLVKQDAVRFNLQTQLTSGIHRLRDLKNDLAKSLGIESVKLDQQGEQIQLEVERPYTPPVALLDLMALLKEVPPVTAVLGLAEDGRPVLLDFMHNRVTHVLITGTANAGKTVLLRTIAASLALNNRQSNLQLIMLAAQSGQQVTIENHPTLQPLNYLPHMLADLGHNMATILELLEFLVSEMRYRQQESIKLPHIVVGVDHTDKLIERGGKPVKNALRALIQRGATVGIHLILCSRNPDLNGLGKMLYKYLPMRIFGQMEAQFPTSTPTNIIPDSSQFQGLLGEGDFIATTGQTTTHFQAAYLGDYDLHLGLKQLIKPRPVVIAEPYSTFTQPKPKETHGRITTSAKPPTMLKGVVSLQ
ncbi:MAG: hypothetical protein KDE48_06225 [Anaerolineales bacterium]|nr:hypothetical protein [Anaerolineales bacterium]